MQSNQNAENSLLPHGVAARGLCHEVIEVTSDSALHSQYHQDGLYLTRLNHHGNVFWQPALEQIKFRDKRSAQVNSSPPDQSLLLENEKIK